MGRYNSFNQNPFSVFNKVVNSIGEGIWMYDVLKIISQKRIKAKWSMRKELDLESADLVQKYCKKVFIGNWNFVKLPSTYLNYFDFIIFADDLEHLNILK